MIGQIKVALFMPEVHFYGRKLEIINLMQTVRSQTMVTKTSCWFMYQNSGSETISAQSDYMPYWLHLVTR